MRLIDADAYQFPGDLVNEPTIDAVPVVHGRWMIEDGYPFEEDGCCHLVCSVCKRIVFNIENPKKAIEYRPYCHCGAKMDGGSE